MNNEDFWTLVALIDTNALDEGNESGAVENLTDVLATKSESEIGEFEELLAQHLYKIDGKKWCDESGDSSRSSDGFLYARCYVVAKGQEYYKAVSGNPSLMPKTYDEWAEAILYVAARAWAKATGKDEDDFDLFPSVSYETGSNESQW